MSGIKHLVVRPVSAIRNYTSLEQDSLTAGRELDVDYVVEGNLQMVGDKTRATVRLLSVKDGKAIWTDKCDQSCNNIFELQDAVAQQIVGQLALQLSSEERTKLAKHYTENTEAYQLYLKGRYYWNKRTEEGYKKGLEYLNQAVQIDPLYALAHSGIADCYALLANSSSFAPGEGFPKAKAAALRALQIDDSLAEAHTSLAFVLYQFDYDFTATEREFKRAIELNPNYATAHHWYADYLSMMGRDDEALREMQLARQNDPLSLVINAELGDYLRKVGQNNKALEQLQKTLEMDPNFIRTHQILGILYMKNGMYDQAIAEFQRVKQVDNTPRMLMRLGQTYAVAGRRIEALKTIEELKAMSRLRYVPPLYLATIYTALGDNDLAFSWLEKASEQRVNMALVKTDEDFSKLRSDPKFTDRLRRLGISP
jgi:tetratricopeptide (TPR) repeat protein